MQPQTLPDAKPTEAQALCIRRAAGQVPGEDIFASRPDVQDRCELAGWIDREPGEDGRWFATPSGLAAIGEQAEPATEQLPDPLAFALDEVLATVNGVDPIEPDAEYEDCSAEELHIHKQLGRIRALISQIRAEHLGGVR